MKKTLVCIPMVLTMSAIGTASGPLSNWGSAVNLPSLSTVMILMASAAFFRWVPMRKS